MKMSGQLHAPASLSPEKEPSAHWLGQMGPRTGMDAVDRRKLLPLTRLELRSSTSQHVASRYTDWAIPAPIIEAAFKWREVVVTWSEALLLYFPERAEGSQESIWGRSNHLWVEFETWTSRTLSTSAALSVTMYDFSMDTHLLQMRVYSNISANTALILPVKL
jgi:hypothetical protein